MELGHSNRTSASDCSEWCLSVKNVFARPFVPKFTTFVLRFTTRHESSPRAQTRPNRIRVAQLNSCAGTERSAVQKEQTPAFLLSGLLTLWLLTLWPSYSLAGFAPFYQATFAITEIELYQALFDARSSNNDLVRLRRSRNRRPLLSKASNVVQNVFPLKLRSVSASLP